MVTGKRKFLRPETAPFEVVSEQFKSSVKPCDKQQDVFHSPENRISSESHAFVHNPFNYQTHPLNQEEQEL